MILIRQRRVRDTDAKGVDVKMDVAVHGGVRIIRYTRGHTDAQSDAAVSEFLSAQHQLSFRILHFRADMNGGPVVLAQVAVFVGALRDHLIPAVLVQHDLSAAQDGPHIAFLEGAEGQHGKLRIVASGRGRILFKREKEEILRARLGVPQRHLHHGVRREGMVRIDAQLQLRVAGQIGRISFLVDQLSVHLQRAEWFHVRVAALRDDRIALDPRGGGELAVKLCGLSALFPRIQIREIDRLSRTGKDVYARSVKRR